MRITVEDFNGRDVRVSLQAESAAEEFQLSAIEKLLVEKGAQWHRGDYMHGSDGISLVVNKCLVVKPQAGESIDRP